jgi:hypothetical protein
MHDQHKNNRVMAKYRGHRHVIKAGTKPGLYIQLRKQRLNDYKARKGCKPLALETKLWNTMDTGENLCFTKLHYQWPPGSVDFATRTFNFNQSGGRFACVHA